MDETVADEREVTFDHPMSFVEEVSQTQWASPSVLDKLKRVQSDPRLGEFSKINPQRHQIFRVLRSLTPSEVKVVILGQDPYPTPGHACGLCFSFDGRGTVPKSLQNINTELKNEGFAPKQTGDLSGWLEQGVLLLNTALTVETGCSGSHLGVWDGFAKLLLEQIPGGYVALLWGKQAQKYEPVIRKGGGVCLSTSHPSPYSASEGFFGCNHFISCNDHLKKLGKTPINW